MARNRWTRPGTVPIVLAVIWAFSMTLFFLASPIMLSGQTIVEAGGVPALLTVVLPLGATGALLAVRDETQRKRWVLIVAVLLTVLGVLVPVPIGFYFVSAIALWASYSVLRREP